ncbi:MAG: aldo/keto reductase [Methanobacteriota archaeon]|nr:MAG: aldo/keto reductase [Euryarchaeota archaeon]
MRTRVLGRTRLQVSEIGFGAWAVGGNAHGNSYGPTDDGESVAAIRRALDLEVNFFDTADVYGWGHSEEILGQALEGHEPRAGVHRLRARTVPPAAPYGPRGPVPAAQSARRDDGGPRDLRDARRPEGGTPDPSLRRLDP